MFAILKIHDILDNNKEFLLSAEEIYDIIAKSFSTTNPIEDHKNLFVIESLLDHLAENEKIGIIKIRCLKLYFA